MKKFLTLVSVIAFVFTSCSKDDNPAEEQSTSTGPLLTKTIDTLEDGSILTTNYTYNGNKLISIVNSDGESETFLYNLNGQLSSSTVEELGSGNNLETINVTFNYDSQSRITSVSHSNGILLEYVHNLDGSITEKNYGVVNGVTTLSTEYKCTFDNSGNLTSQVGTGISTGNSFVNQYDTKNGVFKSQNFSKELYFSYFGFDYINNLTSSIYNNDPSSQYNSYTYVYTYNADGYPVTSVETNGAGEEISTQYFY